MVLGVLKKSEIFRSHVYVTSDGTNASSETQALQSVLFAEKEKAVVGAIETGEQCLMSRMMFELAAVGRWMQALYLFLLLSSDDVVPDYPYALYDKNE